MSLFTRMAAGVLFAGLVTCQLSAQMPDQPARQKLLKETETILQDVPAVHKEAFKTLSANGKYNLLRVLQDIRTAKSTAGKVAIYTVPALSNIPRVGDQFPMDGTFGAPLDIVMARGEFEPGSIQVYAFQDQDKVQLSMSPLKTADGKVLPADAVDLKVIKVWYQNNNAWFNYFGDFTKKLVPELLLNDEDLIRVDTEKKENYVRVNYENGKKYIWISAPEQIDPGFNMSQEPVFDAAKLQPVKLDAYTFKQFFVTIRTTKDTAPGLYTGELSVGSLAKVPVRVRVLPFVLPDPKTYYDTNADFYTMLYCVPGMAQYYPQNGNVQEASDKKAFARLVNQLNHNVNYPLYMGLWNGYKNLKDVKNSLALAKKAGMKMDPFFEAFSCAASRNTEHFLTSVRRAKIAKQELGKILGHTNLWPAGGEEPGFNGVVNARRNWKVVHDLGMHVMCNGGDRRHYSGYNDEFRVGGGFASLDAANFMHRIQSKIGNYAGPHTGPENPDYMRRMHGINLYKKDYDMMYNYGYHEGGWNDFHPNTYRNMCLVYYTYDNVIDTLAWEGIREGIDDIRYATLMMTLAKEAAKFGNKTEVFYAGRKALQFMALLREEEADLPAMRMEVIRHIITLKAMLGK